MDPGTLSIVASIGSTVMSMAGASRTAQAQADAANYQAQVARNNSILAQQQRDYSLQQGAIDESNQKLKTGQILAAEQAGFAASGVDTASGTPADVMESSAELGSMDALTIRNNATRTAYGYQVQADAATSQGQLFTAQAQNDLTAGNANMLASFIGGASSVADKWSKFKNVGLT